MAVAVTVQQRVVGADGADGDERDDSEDDDGYRWWQSEAGTREKWRASQWEVLPASRARWEAGLQKVGVNDS